MSKTPLNIQIMAKPIGPLCNLDCAYCFYKQQKSSYPKKHDFKMTEKVLSQFIRQYIAMQSGREISFAWQGGEPMLTGLDFFELAVSLQQKYCPPGKSITNIIQTNGTLVDRKWCELFKKNNFLVGISLDGPEEMHDRYRVDQTGQPSFAKVSQA
ncbi:MAG: radical SAM protein, partial [Proteobacteria bacterium]|nr:radical SAM protein [Pseudomonadota bacterium]